MHANTQHTQSHNRPHQYLSFRHANTHISTHTHTHTCTHLQTHTHTHTRTCTHLQTHTHTHTHMNTHTQSCGMIAGHSTHLHSNNEQQGVHVGETRHYSVHQTTHPYQGWVHDHRNHHHHLQHILWTRQAQSIRLRNSLTSFSEQSLQSPQSPSAHPVDQTSTVNTSEKQSHFIFRAEFTITAITFSTSCGPDKHSQYVWETVSLHFQSRVYNHRYHLQHILWTRQAQSIRLSDSLRSFSEQSLQSPQSPSAHPVDQTSTVNTSEKQSHFIFRAEFTITAITFSTSCGPDKHSQYVLETVSVPFHSRVYNHRNHHHHLQHILWTRQAQSICLRNSLTSFSEQSLQSLLSPAAHPVDQTSTVNTSERQSPFLFRAEFTITAITFSTSCGSDKYSQYVWGTGSVPFRSRVYNHCYHRNHLQHNLGNT